MSVARPRRAASTTRAAALAAVAVLGLVACQPVDDELAGDAAAEVEDEAAPAPGAPAIDSRMPADLEALLAEHAGTAAQWQTGAVPVEIVAQLDAGRWVAAAITYLAPDADRFLVVRSGPDGTGQERPTLETLGLQAVPAGGVEAIPPLPALAQPPAALAEDAADVLADCGADDDVTLVLYATGAPASWDGTAWAEPPGWTATLSTEEAAGAVVDPVTGEAAGRGCFAAG